MSGITTRRPTLPTLSNAPHRTHSQDHVCLAAVEGVGQLALVKGAVLAFSGGPAGETETE